MKNFIIWLLIAFVFIGSVVYFVFNSDSSLTITYIKFNANSNFIIGINDKEEVHIFNPLNEKAKIFNLNMFNGYKLDKAMEVIYDCLNRNNYLENNQIDITVITKNVDKQFYYYNIISDTVKKHNDNILIVNNAPTHDELVTYSNEVVYDVNQSYTEDNLKEFSNQLVLDISAYVDNLINELSFEDDILMSDKIDAINQKDNEGYFNNFNLKEYKFDGYNFTIKDNSTYKINFNYEEDKYTFDVEIDMVLESIKEVREEDILYNIIEEYHFKYKDNQLYGMKNNFYKYI